MGALFSLESIFISFEANIDNYASVCVNFSKSYCLKQLGIKHYPSFTIFLS